MEEQGLELLNEDYLMSKIYIIRGVQVMLDADLAAVYGYETRSFNQQVKNNIEKFDADFRFQLTKEEYQELLRSKNLTSNNFITNYKIAEYDSIKVLTSKNLISKTEKRGGRKHLPYVFSEQGIYMLMTVLKGELAVSQSKKLIRLFKRWSFSKLLTQASKSPSSAITLTTVFTKQSSTISRRNILM